MTQWFDRIQPHINQQVLELMEQSPLADVKSNCSAPVESRVAELEPESWGVGGFRVESDF